MIIKTKINNKVSFYYLVRVAKAIQERFNPFILDIKPKESRIVLNPAFIFSGDQPETLEKRLHNQGMSYGNLFLNNCKTKRDLYNLLTALRLYKVLESGSIVI